MTDTPGREPESDDVRPPTGSEPGGPGTRLPARRAPSEPAPVDRFSSAPQARRFELTPERAAGIVRQSSSARWVGFLSVVVTVLFVIGYYFYELGLPGGLSVARLGMEEEAQQVRSVERGYNLYQANCARCHGVNGEGGVGPVLNDQEKLYQHLDEEYLKNVLEVGGRYVCGNAESLMPVWSDRNGGPLNYREIEELIAFLRAPSDHEYDVRDPALNEPTGETFRGWRDPNYEPPPGASPYPDCYLDALGGGGASASPGGGASLPPDAETVSVAASNIQFTETELTAPADAAFGLEFDNQDAQPHDVDIRDSGGTVVFDMQFFTGPGTQAFTVDPLPAAEYEFFCSIHPTMTGTLTVE